MAIERGSAGLGNGVIMKKFEYSREELSLIESSRVPVAVYQFIDRRVVTIALSVGFCELFGYELSEAYRLMDRDMYRDTHPDDVARIADAALRFATEDGEYDVVYRTKVESGYRIIHAHGVHVLRPVAGSGGVAGGKAATDYGIRGADTVRLAIVWYADEGPYSEVPSEEPQGKGYSLTPLFNDLLHEETLFQASRYDQLTGLPSMTYFFELAEAGCRHLLDEGRTPAVVFIDMTGMKFFNSRYGFAEGDNLIHAFAKLLVWHFSNESCGRFGQDHFAVFTDAEGLEDKLRDIFAECKGINKGKSLPLRVGVYLQTIDLVSASVACDRAKFACDKNRGVYMSSFTYFSEDMLASVQNRQYVIDNIDRAIDEGWVRVYYQPIVRASNGKVCDEEALARWADPKKGLLSPADFIPPLEDAKLIYKLDLYVVQQVLDKIRRQADAGLHIVPQSVNLSRTDFDACDIVEEICKLVDAAGVPRNLLTIEITESVVGSDFEFMKQQVKRFQNLGFPVWMDDFGSGYSSLDVLQNIRFDLIKFDMRFMKQFDNSHESRIILTELTKMAIGLGIDTVVEGVETAEQVEFLREVGSSKLQGFYYCPAIPLEEIVRRNEWGEQIGYENPDESDYYAAVGSINLYDTAIIAREDQESLHRYFDTLPMGVIESNGKEFTIIRCNAAYREFMGSSFGVIQFGATACYPMDASQPGQGFLAAIRQCGETGTRVIVDEEMPDGSTVHAFVKRVAINPVTGNKALAVVVLAVMEESERGLGTTYANMARALSADYFDLYYVDTSTDCYVQYTSDPGRKDMVIAQHGDSFFDKARSDASRLVYEDDHEYFLKMFTKENVLKMVDENGSFTLTYRLLVDGEPEYVNMKVIRMKEGDDHVILGINNVDAQMKERKAMERMLEERTTFERITALAGNFICVYVVDPQTNHYIEYSVEPSYAGLGVAKEGDDFFSDSFQESERVILADDRALFREQFTKERIMEAIERDGLFVSRHRLVIDGEPVRVRVKAALVEERDGPQLIVGVNLVEDQRRLD